MARAQILVADRDLGFARGLAANLESLGYAITEVVSSSEEAVKKAQEKQPDLVLLDLGLLRDGKKKASQDLRKRIPNLVYLVGEEDPQTLERAQITHSFDYLRRACDPRELETIIDMALYRQKWQQREEKQTAKIGKITAKFKSETDRHQLLENVHQAERKKLFAVLDTLPAYVVLLAQDYSVPYANREFERRFGAPAGRKCYEFLFSRTSPCPGCETFKVLQTNAPHEWEWTGPDDRDYQIYDFPFPNTDGTTMILEMGVDVTVLKEKEAQIQKANRALRTLSAAIKAVVRADTEAELLQNVCRTIVEEGGYRLAWIGYAENDRGKTVRPMAQAGYEEGYLETLKITWADTEQGRGPTGTAIRTGRPATARNMLIDPHFAPWRQEALKRGYASSLGLPLIKEETVFGALNIYAGEADAFDADEVQLLTDLAVDVSFGVMALRAREERRQMAAALRRSYEEMEARVQDRTQDLAQSNAKLQNEIAERLWSEKKLRESEERYRHLVDLSPDAIAVQSQGRYLFINPAGARLFGASDPRDMVGKAVPDVIHPDYRQLVAERICRINTEGEKTKLQEIKILRPDGRVVDVEVSGVGINYQGQPAVQVMMRNITRRKEMERKLEHQASFPRLNPNPVLEADLSGKITYANAASLRALKRLGLENRTSAFLPRDLDQIMVDAARTGETDFYRELQIGDGFFAASISFHEEFEAIRIYARDITPQKRAEIERQDFLEKLQASEEELQVQNEELQVQSEELQAMNREMLAAHAVLREREAQLQTIFENLTEGVVVSSLDGQILNWNQAALEMHGFSSLDEVRHGLPEFADIFELTTLEGAVLPMRQWPLSRILRGEQLRNLEVRVRRLDGTWAGIFNYAGALVRDRDGSPLLAIVSMADITERKQAEEALQESRKDLNRAQAVAHTGSWRLDVWRNELTWSDETHRIFGIPPETPMTYETFLARVYPEDREYVDREWTAALRGEPYDIEHRIVVGDTVKWVRERAELEFDAQGRLLGGFGTTQDITERKRGEEALHREKNISETTIESLPGIFYLFDSQGRFLKWNKNFERVSGYTSEELFRMSPLDFFVGEDKQLIEQSVQEVFTKGETTVEAEFVSKNGRKIPYFFTGVLTTIDKANSLIGMGIDIAARKEAEKTLQASRDFLEIANRHTQMAPLLQDFAAAVKEHASCEAVAIRILDDQGKIPYEAYKGFSQEFIACESPLSIHADHCLCINVIKGDTDPNLPCYTEGSSCYINRFSHLLATSPPGLLGETRNVCHHFGYESLALIPIVFGGQILGLIHLADCRENVVPRSLVERLERIGLQLGTAINRVRAEEERQRLIQELDTERSRLQAIIESAPEAIVVVDAEGRLLMTNPAADRLYSHPDGCVQDAPSCALFQFCHADGSTCISGDQPLLRSAKEGEVLRNLEMVLAWPDGRRRDVLVNTAPIMDQQKRSSGAVGLFQDITQRKRGEEKIRKLNAELSDRIMEVSERTLQLEAANKELEAFSYSVSHDLRTPLRAIEGFARMLVEDHAPKLDGEGLRLLDVIRGNTHIMGDLIDDLLALSRLGRQEIRAQKLDLEGLVTSQFEELRTQEPERRIELILNPLPPAFGDRTLINQVLANLLGNAIKFTQPRKKAIIEVGGWTEGKEVIYFIKDNGVGFDMRYVDKIFGVFQRLHRREEFEGTGVGLAIVQRIINRHGGRVWATGKVGHGAKIYFALPRKGESIN